MEITAKNGHFFYESFSSHYVSEFLHKTCTEVSTGFLYAGITGLSDDEGQEPYLCHSKLFCTCQQFKMAKHNNKAIKTAMSS